MVELPMLVDPEGSTLIFEKNNMGGGCFGNIEDTNIEVRNIFFSIPLPFFKDRKDYFLQVFCADVLNGYLLIITVLVPSKTPNKTSPQD